jgi:hypothetical protein
VINSSQDTTHITLSRSITLGSKSFEPEGGANVMVEGDNNTSYHLIEDLKVVMVLLTSTCLPKKYRLHTVAADGKKYLSDLVKDKTTPPIDTIAFKPLISGVQFYVSAHDVGNKTRYYRWDYDEIRTYEAAYAQP